MEEYDIKCPRCGNDEKRLFDNIYEYAGYKYTWCSKCKKCYSWYVSMKPLVQNISTDMSMFEKKRSK